MRRNGILATLALVGLCFLSTSAVVRAEPPDTPFGVTFNTPELEDLSLDDVLAFFDHAEVLGSTVMLVWQWNHTYKLENLRTHADIAKRRGLKLIIQISNTSQGAQSKIFAPDGFEPTFGDPETRQRYIDDAVMIASLEPEYLNISPEVNLLHYYDNDEFRNYVSLYQEAYDAVKLSYPDVKVGVSYLDLPFVGVNQTHLPDVLGPRDFIGITTYPDARFDVPEDLEANWYKQFRNLFPNDAIVISEIGWGSRTSSLDIQARFVAMLPELLRDVNPELVIWALLYEVEYFLVDQIPLDVWEFLLSIGVDPVELFDKFNSLGLIAQDGTEKPAYFEALNLDFGTITE